MAGEERLKSVTVVFMGTCIGFKAWTAEELD